MRNNTRMGCAVALVAGVATLSAQTPVVDPLRAGRRTLREAGARGRTARRRLRGRVLRAAGVAEAGRSVEDAARDDRFAGRRSGSRPQPTTGVTPPNKADAELWGLRRQYLARQLAAMRARLGMLQGKKLTFDEESLALYDAVAPVKPESEFQAVLKQLDARLPGEGSLIDRYDALQAGLRDSQGARRSRVPGGDSRLPPADEFRRSADGRNVQGRVRHRQIVERLQLVSGQLQEPDPGEHRSADLHRSRDRPGVSRGLSRAITSTTRCSRRTWSTIAAGSNSRSTRCSRRSR